MSDLAVRQTNELRRTLGPRSKFRDPDFLRGLAGALKRLPQLARRPAVECFIADLETCGDDIALPNTKAHINERRDNEVFSLFDVPYFPTLSLDYFQYEPLNVVESAFAAKFASNANPVTIRRMSDGFTDRVVVALFPENHIDDVQRENDAIFYFIDKFVERYERITRKMLDHVVSPAAFPLVRGATTVEIERAASHWVWLHEFFHRQGDMPLPEYLPLKVSRKSLSGLEELRVDIAGILACRADCGLSERDATMARQFIFAERLLRYSVEGIPRPNYDAVASQLLFNYLREHDGIWIKNGQIHVSPRAEDVLQSFADTIAGIERRVLTDGPQRVEARLVEFVNRFTDYDAETDDYRHTEFFYEVKLQLGV